ncbi:MAG TPA: 16S rRNA (uracil(1498)-N(3))-methyltransferase [Pyrinomonadaceae bacterium]|nr:16S rRNA (uracil(1498)-N(3))-methyltransferase [Pyrinomonadaceae bacterium]
MTVRRFFAPPSQFVDGIVTLDEDETRHLRDVLRLKAGDTANIFDGEGREFECRIAAIEKRQSTLTIQYEVEPASSESSLDLAIAAVLLKGDKLDLVVQKAVELGVNRFIPMASARCDVKAADPSKRSARWKRIAMEATKQCGRARLMQIEEVIDFRELIDRTNDQDLTRIHFSERDGESFDAVEGAKKILAFIGPEGGWDDAEIEKATAARITSITFGGRILKADTAAISIASILQHRFGDIN